jgi:hypothetical protein
MFEITELVWDRERTASGQSIVIIRFIEYDEYPDDGVFKYALVTESLFLDPSELPDRYVDLVRLAHKFAEDRRDDDASAA